MADLAWPPDYNPRSIPPLSRLQRASVNALDKWSAFVMTNKDSPASIAGKLDEIANATRAALDVKGAHIPKAIKLALELEMRYWAYGNRYEEWFGLMGQLLRVAPELDDAALKSEIFRAWGIYLYVMRDTERAKVAVTHALEYAEESDQASLRLLTRAETFNLSVRNMPLAHAQAEANALIADGKRLQFPYVVGRVYLTMGLYYQELTMPREAFSAAQQALVCFSSPAIAGMQAYAVSLMLGNIQFNNMHSRIYRKQLLGYLTRLTQHTVNPFFRAAVAHLQANETYYAGNYVEARRHALSAWLNYRHVNRDAVSCRDIQHLLGMIETQLHHPASAERHLKAARTYFQTAGETTRQIHAQHALAWVPFTHGDPARALALIDEALALVDTLPEAASRERLRDLLLGDRTKIERSLETMNP